MLHELQPVHWRQPAHTLAWLPLSLSHMLHILSHPPPWKRNISPVTCFISIMRAYGGLWAEAPGVPQWCRREELISLLYVTLIWRGHGNELSYNIYLFIFICVFFIYYTASSSGQGMWHIWGRTDMHTGFWEENLKVRLMKMSFSQNTTVYSIKVRDHVEDLGVDGRMKLQWILKK